MATHSHSYITHDNLGGVTTLNQTKGIDSVLARGYVIDFIEEAELMDGLLSVSLLFKEDLICLVYPCGKVTYENC